jgi:hypothetical protein
MSEMSESQRDAIFWECIKDWRIWNNSEWYFGTWYFGTFSQILLVRWWGDGRLGMK